ncbi:phosphoprotein [Tuhoko virus 3]|uniref:Phosphoprotein n=1 Tax=Tuhoko virus 3 TaxID=798074 RepID=D8WJ37_9MONO|nr:phosphoprotein [Tuhoko virus 3]ADI80724.1 phosphoprotein [Tuhoko virus 3]
MEPTPSDAEISAWIEKGLATAKHFAPNPVSSQSSLGKSTIKKGNTKVLVSSAEQIASSQPAASHTVKVQAQVHPQQPTASQPCTGARPKTKRTATPAPTPSVQQAVKIEPVYEDIVSNPTHQAENAPLIATQSSAKQSLLCTEPLPSQPSSATRCGEQSFKRGGDFLPVPPGRDPTVTQDTDENLILFGAQENLRSENGATQPAPQSLQSPEDISAVVGNALESANSVREIIRYLKVMEAKMTQIEWKVDKVLAQNSLIQQVRNEQLVLKASMATIEGLMTTIKIMDPGVGPGATAAQAKRLFKEAPVVVSGPIVGDNDLIFEDKIEISSLGKPQKVAPQPKKRLVTSEADIAGYKLTLTKLLKECIPNANQHKKFEDLIASVKNESDFKAAKREIVRAAI